MCPAQASVQLVASPSLWDVTDPLNVASETLNRDFSNIKSPVCEDKQIGNLLLGLRFLFINTNSKYFRIKTAFQLGSLKNSPLTTLSHLQLFYSST